MSDHPTPATCPSCGTPLSRAPGIGPYCPNKDGCDRVDDLEPAEWAAHPTQGEART